MPCQKRRACLPMKEVCSWWSRCRLRLISTRHLKRTRSTCSSYRRVSKEGLCPHAMRQQALCNGAEETTPRQALLVFGRRIPTPCTHHMRANPAKSLLQSGARGTNATEQPCEPAQEAPIATRPVPTVLSLETCLPTTAGVPTRPMQTGICIDDFLHSALPFLPASLTQEITHLRHLHPAAQTWHDSLPTWDRHSRLDKLTLYTDGSFTPAAGAAWAIVATGLVHGGREVFVGFVGDRLWPAGHPLYVGHACQDAHSAELVALLFAMAVASTQDGTAVHVVGDCTSALDIAAARAQSQAHTALASAVLDLHIFADQRGTCLTFQHVPSHEGVPGNEFADCVAKHFVCSSVARTEFYTFCEYVRGRRLSWLWWTATVMCQRGQLPGLSDDGHTLPDSHRSLPRFHTCHTLPGVPQLPERVPVANAAPARWKMRAATYNCNSLKQEAERHILDDWLHRHEVHFAGLQETRHYSAPRTSTKHYHCFSSRDVKGNFGCQIWISATLPLATREDGRFVLCDLQQVTVIHSCERILALCITAGDVLFGVVSAHAPVSAASEEIRTQWWDRLRGVLRKLPRRAVPVLLADCNARFTASGPTASVSAAVADNDNGRALQWLCDDFCLQSSNLFDEHGHRVVTWTSPYGNATQLDFVLLPSSLAATSRTLASPAHLPKARDVDHRPLVVETLWHASTVATGARPRWDVAKMRTAEGRQCLAAIFQSMPHVPWTYDVDDHLQLVNNHLYVGLQRHFPAPKCRPRQAHISDLQWQTIRSRRQARRLIRRCQQQRRRQTLDFFLRVWRALGAEHRGRRAAHCARVHRSRMQEVRMVVAIRTLSRALGRLSQRDSAEFTRKVFREARDKGPAALYGALRGVMKVGRRYKPPRVLPALHVDGQTLADPRDIKQALINHFVAPEHGTPATISDVSDRGAAAQGALHVVSLDQLPSLSDIIQGFLALQDTKAPGASGIPAEVYRHCAIHAAISHAPVLLKIASRQQWPLLWRGTLNAAIPKPSKDGSRLQSWRSIALAKAAFKGVGKALRTKLAAGLRRIITPGQHGSLPGEQIGLPAHTVQAYLQYAQTVGQSATVLFLDGRSAYYATIRDFLFTHELESPADLHELVRLLVPDESLHDQLVAALVGPGLLAQAQLGTSLQDFLRGNLKATWFTMDLDDPVLQQTRSGTAPGSPLADLLYQFVQTQFMLGVMQDMRDQGLCIRMSVQSDPTYPQGWADDVAVMLPPCHAAQVAPQIQACVPILDLHSRRMGVSLNFDSGKTEALISLRGKGCVAVKRALLTTNEPAVPVHIPGQASVCLRLNC